MEVAMQKNTQKVKNILETLPYIEAFRNKIFVFKFGGSLINNKKLREVFIKDIILLRHLNMNVVIVHGGGKNISKRLEACGLEGKFHKGYRITNQDAIKEVEMVLTGEVNQKLTLDFVTRGVKAIGLTGKDAGLIQANKKVVCKDVDIGHVGEITEINSAFIHMLLNQNYLPIISPIGYDLKGMTYNINADDVASEMSAVLNAEKLFLISDVKGLYRDFSDSSSFISSINVNEAKALIDNKEITGGMLPKLQSCINAVNKGAKAAHIIDGRLEHGVLLEIFTNSGIGTIVKGDKYDINGDL